MKTEIQKGILITPEIKIAVLFDNYPQIKDTFIRILPRFKDITEPFLRETVAKVTSLRQAAIIGDLNLSDLLNRLRKETGEEEIVMKEIDTNTNLQKPDWLDMDKIVTDYDAKPDLQAGIHPVAKITNEMEQLKSGDIYQLRTSFIPAPLIDLMKSKNYRVFSEKKSSNEVLTFICK